MTSPSSPRLRTRYREALSISSGETRSAQAFLHQLAATTQELTIALDCRGCDALACYAVHDALRSSGRHVTIHVNGFALSGGSIIAAAGDFVSIVPEGVMMMHEPSGPRDAEHERLCRISAEIYARRTGLSVPQIRLWMARETWFSASEAVRFGLADQVGFFSIQNVRRPNEYLFTDPRSELAGKNRP